MAKCIITIGRQFGSGGREIGERLSKRLGIKYYDKEILEVAAENSGLAQEVFEQIDEKRGSPFASGATLGHTNYMGAFYSFNDALSADTLFIKKADAIKKIAEESCIIVGRCADYILRERDDVLSVFIHCNDEKVKHDRVAERHPEIADKNIDTFILRTDKERASYYSYYTDQTWGDARHYDLSVDTSFFGLDGAVNVIAAAIKEKFGEIDK